VYVHILDMSGNALETGMETDVRPNAGDTWMIPGGKVKIHSVDVAYNRDIRQTDVYAYSKPVAPKQFYELREGFLEEEGWPKDKRTAGGT